MPSKVRPRIATSSAHGFGAEAASASFFRLTASDIRMRSTTASPSGEVLERGRGESAVVGPAHQAANLIDVD
jgi:hypothetical protein